MVPAEPRETCQEQPPRIEVVRVDPAGTREARVECLILEGGQSGGMGNVDRDRIEGNGRVLQHAIDDGLVLLGGEGAGGVEYRAAGAGESYGSPE